MPGMLIIGFRNANGTYSVVSAANPLPVTGGGGGGGGDASAANQVEMIAALGAPDDIAWAGTGDMTLAAGIRAIATAAADTTTPLPVKGQAPLVRVTPAIQTGAYTTGTVLFATTAIANLSPSNDQGFLLESLTLIDGADQGAAVTLHFFSSNVTFGTVNSAPSVSDADMASSWLGSVDILTTDYKDVGGAKAACIKAIALNLIPGSGVRTVWVAAVVTGTPTYGSTSAITLGVGGVG